MKTEDSESEAEIGAWERAVESLQELELKLQQNDGTALIAVDDLNKLHPEWHNNLRLVDEELDFKVQHWIRTGEACFSGEAENFLMQARVLNAQNFASTINAPINWLGKKCYVKSPDLTLEQTLRWLLIEGWQTGASTNFRYYLPLRLFGAKYGYVKTDKK